MIEYPNASLILSLSGNYLKQVWATRLVLLLFCSSACYSPFNLAEEFKHQLIIDKNKTNQLVRVNLPDAFHNLTNDNRTGIADQFVERFKKAYPNTATFSYQPFARAVSSLERFKLDCFVGANKAQFKRYFDRDVIVSDILSMEKWVIINRKGLKTVSSLNELKGKTVAAMRGIRLTEDVLTFNPDEVFFELVPTEKVVMRMVAAERLNYGVISVYDDQVLEEFSYHSDLFLYRVDRRITCQTKTEQVRAFLKKANRVISEMSLPHKQ